MVPLQGPIKRSPLGHDEMLRTYVNFNQVCLYIYTHIELATSKSKEGAFMCTERNYLLCAKNTSDCIGTTCEEKFSK